MHFQVKKLLVLLFVASSYFGASACNGAEQTIRTVRTNEAATEAQIREWIVQLGDRNFSTRQEANRHLIDSGIAALQQLRKAVEHPDRELSHRARRLVTFLEQLERRRLVEAFASAEKPGEFNMPCWDQFKKTIGDLPAAQSLFAEMLRYELELLQVAQDGTDDEFYSALEKKISSLMGIQRSGEGYQVETGSLCAIHFCSTLRSFELDDSTAETLVASISLPKIETVMRLGEFKDVVSKLIAISVFDNDSIEDSLFFGRGQVNMAAALPRARRLAVQRNEIAFLRHSALNLISQFGDQSDLKLMESLFDDQSIRRNARLDNGTLQSTTMGDVALHVALDLLDKKPSDIDVDTETEGLISFADKTTRDASRTKYRELKKQVQVESKDGGKASEIENEKAND